MRWPTGRLQRVVLLVAAAALGLAACSDPPPKAGSVPSDSPTPTSASPSPTPATPEEQVEAAVRAYYAELTRAAQTNDTSKLKTLTTKACPCYRPVQVIRGLERRNESAPQAAFEVSSLTVREVTEQTASVAVETRDKAYKILDSDGRVIHRVKARRALLDLSLVKSDAGAWVIANEFNLRG